VKNAKTILFIVLLALVQNGEAQGFVNLDFEDAIIVADPSSPYYPNAVYASDAIPGWAVTGNFLGPNEIVYNALSLGAPSVALLGVNSQYIPLPLDGAFSIDLYGGAGPSTNVSISQMGLVPANAASIRFSAQGVNPPSAGGPLLVSLGGQSISFSAISTGPNYTLYGGNIPSAFAGQNEQLTFLAPTDGGNNYWEIDDIQFSPSSVPEPSVFGLFALGGLFFGLRCWRKCEADCCQG
jgi:hypothetical protein